MPAVPTARVVAAEPVGDRGANRVEREHVQAGDGVGGGFQPGQVRLVGVGLAEADQSGVGVELDDRAQRVRLVHADGVEQRRVDERDRRDAGAGDANLARRHGYTRLGEGLGEHGAPGGDDRAQFGEVVGGRHDQRRADRPGGYALHRDAGLDERDGVAGHRVAQPDERVEELPQQRVGQVIVAGFERVVEREREVGGERERGRRVQRHADRAVGLLGGLGGRHAVEEQEVLAVDFKASVTARTMRATLSRSPVPSLNPMTFGIFETAIADASVKRALLRL